jgi:hypothetical protein
MPTWIAFMFGVWLGGGAVAVGVLAGRRQVERERKLAEADTDEFWPPDQGLRLVR